jgi:hypothetical protein
MLEIITEKEVDLLEKILSLMFITEVHASVEGCWSVTE